MQTEVIRKNFQLLERRINLTQSMALTNTHLIRTKLSLLFLNKTNTMATNTALNVAIRRFTEGYIFLKHKLATLTEGLRLMEQTEQVNAGILTAKDKWKINHYLNAHNLTLPYKKLRIDPTTRQTEGRITVQLTAPLLTKENKFETLKLIPKFMENSTHRSADLHFFIKNIETGRVGRITEKQYEQCLKTPIYCPKMESLKWVNILCLTSANPGHCYTDTTQDLITDEPVILRTKETTYISTKPNETLTIACSTPIMRSKERKTLAQFQNTGTTILNNVPNCVVADKDGITKGTNQQPTFMIALEEEQPEFLQQYYTTLLTDIAKIWEKPISPAPHLYKHMHHIHNIINHWNKTLAESGKLKRLEYKRKELSIEFKEIMDTMGEGISSVVNFIPNKINDLIDSITEPLKIGAIILAGAMGLIIWIKLMLLLCAKK